MNEKQVMCKAAMQVMKREAMRRKTEKRRRQTRGKNESRTMKLVVKEEVKRMTRGNEYKE